MHPSGGISVPKNCPPTEAQPIFQTALFRRSCRHRARAAIAEGTTTSGNGGSERLQRGEFCRRDRYERYGGREPPVAAPGKGVLSGRSRR